MLVVIFRLNLLMVKLTISGTRAVNMSNNDISDWKEAVVGILCIFGPVLFCLSTCRSHYKGILGFDVGPAASKNKGFILCTSLCISISPTVKQQQQQRWQFLHQHNLENTRTLFQKEGLQFVTWLSKTRIPLKSKTSADVQFAPVATYPHFEHKHFIHIRIWKIRKKHRIVNEIKYLNLNLSLF